MINQTSVKLLILRAVLRHVSPMVIRQVSVSDQVSLPEFNDIFCAILGGVAIWATSFVSMCRAAVNCSNVTLLLKIRDLTAARQARTRIPCRGLRRRVLGHPGAMF